MSADPKSPAEREDEAPLKLRDQLRGDSPPLEDLPAEWDKEDRKLERRKPDLAETEGDTSRL